MARWLDHNHCTSIVISEHHCSPDGYLPSPLTLAAAMAAATENTTIVVAVAILPFYDTVRLVEDIITLDHLSKGRVMTVFGLGYRPEEYELYGVDFSKRGKIADEKLQRVLQLLDQAADPTHTDQPKVTPPPFSQPRPMIAWGGKTKAAARRAGRNGIGFFAQTNTDGLREAYKRSAADAGHKPGMCMLPSPDTPYAVFISENPDQAWCEIGESILADTTGYAEWNKNDDISRIASFSESQTVDSLQEAQGAHQIITPAQIPEFLATHGLISLHPLIGGLNPDIAWCYLKQGVEAINNAS